MFSVKLYAFAVSSAIAALAGILVGFKSLNIQYGQFNVFESINSVGYAVIGGGGSSSKPGGGGGGYTKGGGTGVPPGGGYTEPGTEPDGKDGKDGKKGDKDKPPPPKKPKGSLPASKQETTNLLPGDTVALKGLDARIVASAGQMIAAPLPGAGSRNPYCASYKPKAASGASFCAVRSPFRTSLIGRRGP